MYDLVVRDSNFAGTLMKWTTKDLLNPDGWFEFVQTDDGAIPRTRFSYEEDDALVNLKKAVVSALQGSFKGDKLKEEADAQSLHVSHYRYREFSWLMKTNN